MKLSSKTVSSLPPAIAVPLYDRSAVTAGIVHFGVGAFHRSHQAMYIDQLMNAGQAMDWGVCGMGIMPYDLAMRDALVSQDFLYTLILKQPDGQHKPSVIGSIVDYIYAPEQPQAALDMLASPSIRIVSLTITEGGYNIDHTTGEFKLQEPNVAHDWQKQSAHPKTVFGLVTEGLRIRRERGIPPFTVLSCDNIQGNGDVAKRVFVSFATAQDSEFGGWVNANVCFPNCMVDRITPVTTSSDKDSLLEKFGIIDAWPVVAEPFTQWVVEDHFSCGRPSIETLPQWCQISVVPDVMPYELMKLRLLNATHQQMTYFGYLSGYRYAHEVAQDPIFVQFLLGYMHEEALPTLLPVPGIDLELYMCTLIRRYANPEVKDTLARLCAESSDRIPKWLLPVVREQLAKGGDIRRSAAVVASWARYAEAVDEDGHPINVVDRLKISLVEIASKNRSHSSCFIENKDVFGELAQDKRFVTAYLHALHLLHTVGARKTVQTLNFELQAVPVAYKLTYFDLPGLAETTRLCFAATGTPFEDVRLPNYQAFQEMQVQCPMGTVPILDVGCACIPQSKAIERYVAKRLGLLGIDPFEEALVDSVCELIRDMEQSLNADSSKFLSVDLPDALIVISQFISRACGGFCVGCCLSLADIKVFQFFNPTIFHQQHDAWHSQLPSLLAQYPRVSSLITRVGAVSGIKDWMQTKHPSSHN